VLGRLIDPSGLDIAVRLSTAQVALLLQPDGSLGAGPVSVRLPAFGESTPARIDRMGASVGDGQTGRVVYVALDTSPATALLQPGDFVEVAIEEAPLSDAALLPASALGSNGTVLALGPEDRLQELAVEVLRRQGDDVIIRVAGLTGREVVTERSALLGDGIRIRPIRPGAAVEEKAMVPLTPERRAELIAMVEANERMPAEVKSQLLQELQAETVPAATLERLERRMGG
jgi:hypothetical protein